MSTDESGAQIPLQTDVRMAQKCAGDQTRPEIFVSHEWQACVVRTHPRHFLMPKRRCRFLSGISDHGPALKPTSAFNGSLPETMRGDDWKPGLDLRDWLNKSLVATIVLEVHAAVT